MTTNQPTAGYREPDHLLGFAAGCYDFNRDTLQFLTGGRDASRQFYTFEKHGKQYIMRFTKCQADLVGQARAEMEWLCYLSQKGISVCRPLRARGGELAVLAEGNAETYSIAAYSKVEGI